MNSSLKINNAVNGYVRASGNTLFNRRIENIFQSDFFSIADASIQEVQNGYRLDLAVPGVNRKDVLVQVEENVLSVAIQKTNRSGWNLTTSTNASVRCSFALPHDA